MIMVDEWRRWGTGMTMSCHLTVQGGTLEQLHRFAEQIGLRRSWFQPKSHPHYDILSERRRRHALLLGAEFVPARQQATARIARRRGEHA